MSATYMPANWRDRLPLPSAYYVLHLRNIGAPNADGWAQATCPFHADENRSLSVHLSSERGHWRCSGSCGGGDIVGFHMRLRGLEFKTAVRDLVGLRAAA
jgi:hypothetical protein